MKSGWQVTKPFKQKSLTVPSLHDALLGNKKYYGEYILEKYTDKGFVEVDEGDKVVDVGAFIGGFTLGVEDVTDQVLTVEPVQTNVECLRRNVNPNVDVAEYAIWEKEKTVSFNISNNPQDHSVFDNSNYGRTTISREIDVKTIRLDSLLEKFGYEDIDFLKLEAEGAEPEGLRSLGDVRPPKIAVSCGEEREEENTLEETIQILSVYGYETKTNKNIVYARHRG